MHYGSAAMRKARKVVESISQTSPAGGCKEVSVEGRAVRCGLLVDFLSIPLSLEGRGSKGGFGHPRKEQKR